MTIKCLIVDDEQLARKLLEGYVEKIPGLVNIKSCKNPLEAINILQNEDIELMFLDIQMPDLSGIDFLKTLKKKPLVIFTTAYKEYALEGYELDVIDYMLKPISFERFLQGVNKAAEQLKLKALALSGQPVVHDGQEKSSKEHIQLHADHKLYNVRYDDIMYIEGLKEYVSFFTTEKKIIVLKSLKELEESLPDQFMRIHKSYIINTNMVTAISGNLVEINDKKIPIGKMYIQQARERLYD